MAEFRLVNVAIDLTRTLLEFTRDTSTSLLNGSIGLLGKVEASLPDVPLVSRPGAAAAYRSLAPGVMRALPPAGGLSPGWQPQHVGATPAWRPQGIGATE